MRVLYVHHRSEGGGAPTSLALLIEGLRGRVEATVICPGGAAAERFREAGAAVVEAPVAVFNHSWAGTYRWTRLPLLLGDVARIPRHLRALRRVLRDLEPDLVHLNEMSLLPAAVLAGRYVPVVWHLRAALPLDNLPDTRLVRRTVARRAAVAIAINDDVAASYGSPANMRVVVNPVFVPGLSRDRSEAKRALGLRPEAIVIGMLSKLYRKKGWRDLLEAVAIARRQGADLEVALVGGAVRPSAWFDTFRGRLLGRLAHLEDTERELASSIEALGLSDVVRSLNFQRDVSPVYEALDIVCAPSRGPELGRPVLEGQAHGLPVITTGSQYGGGVVEHDIDGLIVPPGDIDALASGLRRLASDAGLRQRLGEHGHRKAATRYAHGRVADRVLRLYELALGET